MRVTKMKNFRCFLLFAVVCSATFVFGQSGRRVTPSSTPVAEKTPEQIGYSDSAVSAARSIYARKETLNDKALKKTPKTTPTPLLQTEDGEEVLRVDTNLISVPVSVLDKNGRYVSDLLKQDFKIFENGVEQEVDYFGRSDVPFAVALVIDVSPSAQFKIEEIQRAANVFIDQLAPEDSVMVIQFDGSVDELTNFTTDRNELRKAIRRTGFGGGTALYSAVERAMRKIDKRQEKRKAIVLFTDGVDTASMFASFDSTLRDAQESSAVVFPVYYNTFLQTAGITNGGVMQGQPQIGGRRQSGSGTTSQEYARGRVYLNELAEITAGRVYKPENNVDDLTAAFKSVAEEMRTQYTIGYASTADGKIGERRQIRVRVLRPNLIVRSRDSYVIGETK